MRTNLNSKNVARFRPFTTPNQWLRQICLPKIATMNIEDDSKNQSNSAQNADGQELPLGKALSGDLGKQLPKIISFDSLARCGEELWIENNGQIYRLRRTKQGKLILTK